MHTCCPCILHVVHAYMLSMHTTCTCCPCIVHMLSMHLVLPLHVMFTHVPSVAIQPEVLWKPMKTLSPTQRWGPWLASARHATVMHDASVSLQFVERQILPELRAAGFAVPSKRSLQRTLEHGLPAVEPSPADHAQGRPGLRYGFQHILNLFWAPVLEYMDAFTDHEAPEWSETLALHHSALLAEMAGAVPSADEPMDMDSWVLFLQENIARHLKVEVPAPMILKILSAMVPFRVPPTRANALHILRSSWCQEFVGSAMAAQMKGLILAEIADMPVQLLSERDLNMKIRQDLVDSLASQHCEDDQSLDNRPAKKARRDPQSLRELLSEKTAQVVFMLTNRVASTRVCNTLADAQDLIRSLTSGGSDSHDSGPELQEALVTRWTLTRHLQLLDGALDRLTAQDLLDLREQGRFAGVALATDESPPKEPRYRGLRFQITCMYFGTFLDLDRWEACADPPILKTTSLADIMHCPGKRGSDVSRILEKQLARVGLNSYDVVSGTGDGGGENEGQTGIHAHFGYVRHRCLPHISWRTCDAAIRTSGLNYRSLAAYMNEGITWSRLQELATTRVAEGGLGLKWGSRAFKDLFGRSPASLIDARPETDLRFLELLEGQEHLLHQLATQDCDQRALGAEARAAVQSLGVINDRIRRRILQEILHRCMFLYYWTGARPHLVAKGSWDEVMQKAVSNILNLDVTPEVRQRFAKGMGGLGEGEGVVILEGRPDTWVDLAVLQVVGERDLVAERLTEAMDFHRRVSDSAAAHLNLLANNTFRTPWVAAKLLMTDPALAQDAATTLVRHLATTRPDNRSHFEHHLFHQEDLWQSLQDFAAADPPVLLWHGRGKYEALFKFLAPRFLLAPDHVLDAERVHARWQWLCSQKRDLKLLSMNGTLRIMHYLENNQRFPNDDELLEHLETERTEHKMALQTLVAEEEEVALGWRHKQYASSGTQHATTTNACHVWGCLCVCRFVCMHM